MTGKCRKHEARISAEEIQYEASTLYIRCIHCDKLLLTAGVDYPEEVIA